MNTFDLRPVPLEKFDQTHSGNHRISMLTSIPASDVWAQLHSPDALHWCRSIKSVDWENATRGVGTRRTVSLAPGVSVHERYFHWVDEGDQLRQNAFSVEAASFPGIKSFGEQFTVLETPYGTRFDWDFVIEPKVPGVARPAMNAIVGIATIRRIEADTLKHFNGKKII